LTSLLQSEKPSQSPEPKSSSIVEQCLRPIVREEGRPKPTPAKLNHLSNDAEDFGGMMTEIVLTP
jgi:hypothetical protein